MRVNWWKCSSASARRACATCSSRRRRNRRASFSSMNSTQLAASAEYTSARSRRREQTLNQILVEMDGFTANVGVIVLAATNGPKFWIRRCCGPGRFDRQVVVTARREGRVPISRCTPAISRPSRAASGNARRAARSDCPAPTSQYRERSGLVAARTDKSGRRNVGFRARPRQDSDGAQAGGILTRARRRKKRRITRQDTRFSAWQLPRRQSRAQGDDCAPRPGRGGSTQMLPSEDRMSIN